MKTEDYYLALKDYWDYTFLEACETLTKIFHNPEETSRNMNRLNRHGDTQLQATLIDDFQSVLSA